MLIPFQEPQTRSEPATPVTSIPESTFIGHFLLDGRRYEEALVTLLRELFQEMRGEGRNSVNN